MILNNSHTGGIFQLVNNDHFFHRINVDHRADQLLTIAWNNGKSQKVLIDHAEYDLPPNGVVTLVANQRFQFERPKDIVAWQFNRPFYCIIDHDKEVSCVGLLFYGSAEQPIVQLDTEESNSIELLFKVFLEEFQDHDSLQEDMLRMLLKRLIIKITRLYKRQSNIQAMPKSELDLVRQFNLLVESNFKKWHQVQDYAGELHKSAKTLSNYFSKYNSQSPLKIIHNRIVLEAKRLLIYSEQSVQEIAYELGFEEVPPFNRLFKKVTKQTPSQFRTSSE